MVFPKGVYTDVRIEHRYTSFVKIVNGEVEDVKERVTKGAFIRMYDGKMWRYSATTDLDRIEEEIDRLYRLSESSDDILENDVIRKFEVNVDRRILFEERSVEKVPLKEKVDLVLSYADLLTESVIRVWKGFYADTRVVKEFKSSLGSDLVFDFQKAGVLFTLDMADGEKRFWEMFDKNRETFDGLDGFGEELKSLIEESVEFLRRSKRVKPGKYTVILSPKVSGVFAHESFGHKSEADFMVGDETAMKEWAIGKKVGSEILSIIDDGNVRGGGYTPYDDEGIKARKTYLVKNGVLSGRLHSVHTAAELGEEPTGNGRALDFTFEPIVRMTTTYIEPGDLSFDDMISDVKEGIYVKTIKHGSGMSVFTLAPLMAYMIRKGKIAEPVQISVVTGNVFKTLSDIEGLGSDFQVFSDTLGGCGKLGQSPLSVGYGGPHVRVRELEVG